MFSHRLIEERGVVKRPFLFFIILKILCKILVWCSLISYLCGAKY